MVEISNTSLISGLTTKNGNKALFVLRNRAHSFVAENWANNLAHERSLHFRYYSGEKSVERSIVYICKLNAEACCL